MSAKGTISAGSGLEPMPVPDVLGRATLQALLDNDLLGVALLRSGDWVHVMANALYEAVVSGGPSTGRRFSDVLDPGSIPDTTLEAVVSTGRAARVARVVLPSRPDDEPSAARHVTFILLPMRSLGPNGGVLVLVRDVSKEVHDERMAELFILLAREMTAERDDAAAIRTSVAHAKEVLGASAASMFLLGRDRNSLHGALVGWDWTRTSFVADLQQWPNVARAIAKNEACHFMAAGAERAEEGWFERRGITAAICAPMAGEGRVVGVLFFDYAGPPSDAPIDLALAKTVADQCALLVERESARLSRG